MDYNSPPTRPGKTDLIFVGIQFFFFFAYILEIHFWDFHLPAYLSTIFLILVFFGMAIVVLSLIQLNTNLSPFPTPRKGSRLIDTGLYKFVRHPIYSGIFIAMLSYGMYATSLYKILISLTLLLVLHFKSIYEEKRLQKTFSAYEQYRKSTGRFFPKF